MPNLSAMPTAWPQNLLAAGADPTIRDKRGACARDYVQAKRLTWQVRCGAYWPSCRLVHLVILSLSLVLSVMSIFVCSCPFCLHHRAILFSCLCYLFVRNLASIFM